MLATLRPLPVNAEPWALEYKWDGHRCQARRHSDGRVRLDSRNGRDQTDVFPEITAAMAELCGGRRLSLDGEVVALGAHGAPEFERLQRRLVVNPSPALMEQVPVTFVPFDVLDADGPTVDLTYSERRAVLEELNLAHPHLVVPGYQTGIDPASLLQIAQKHQVEGLVLKRLSSKYVSGRSSAWTKHPLRRRIEVVIGGWAPSRSSTDDLGALLVGRPVAAPPGKTRPGLDFVGAVGTGWSVAAGRRLIGQLRSSSRDTDPFSRPVPPEYARAARWVTPQLVVDVEYREFSSAGFLRHGSYKGLRDDRDIADLAAEVAG